MLRRQLITGLLMTIVMTVLVGLLYPLVVTGISQAAMSRQANGSFVKNAQGQVVGSSLIGQSFTDAKGNAIPKYFQSRPSAAGSGYDAMASGGSNLGPSNQNLLEAVQKRAVEYRTLNGLPVNAEVPADAVTSSGSGLDPNISVANADLQAPRVARVRNLPLATVQQQISAHTQDRPLGFLGEQTVNVLDLNLALDRLTH